MNDLKSIYNTGPGKLLLCLLILVFMLSNGEVLAQRKIKKNGQRLDFKVSLSTTYDNNILKYSDKYLERFMNGEDPGRFSIKTYDDLIISPSFQVVYTFRMIKKVNTKLNAEYSPRIYMVNSIKNWSYFTVGFQQYFSKRGSVKILYSYIPEFYVRNFRDENWIELFLYGPESFKPYAFSKDNFGGYVQNTFLKNTRLRFSMFYQLYYHNQYFTEYDSKNWVYALKLYQPIIKQLKIELGYQFTSSIAKGYDAAYETPETTHGPDATYGEDEFSIGLVGTLPPLLKHDQELGVDFEFIKRFYKSTYSPLVDPLHVGRIDDNYRLYFTYKIDLSKAFELTAYYHWLMRDSNTDAWINQNYISNEKDYTESIVGLKLVYRFKI